MVTVTDIPWSAYCVIVTSPTGYALIGASMICTEAAQRPTNITKAFSVAELIGNGSLELTFHSPWGAPIEGVCGQASLLVSGTPFSVGSACSDASGHAVISGLLDGSYILSALTWPNFWTQFSPAPFTIAGGNVASLDTTVNPVTSGNVTITTVLAYGPTTVGGSCWSMANGLDSSAAGYYVIAAPVCDIDDDGVTVLEDIPYGLYCFILIPPTGYYRSDGVYGYCPEQANSSGFGLTVGVTQIPLTPTTTPSPTPSPTPTTPVPTPTPVPNEPNGTIRTQNCADSGLDFYGESYYELCESSGPGIRFAVIQRGVQTQTLTTGADGSVNISLPSREPYQLQYLDGNESLYVPADGESTRVRYGSSQRFVFIRDPQSDHNWTFTIHMYGYSNGFQDRVSLGGACVKIVGATDGLDKLPAVCDTDGDGSIVVGQLPPVKTTSGNPDYQAVMTQAPAGYPIVNAYGGIYNHDAPNSWEANFTYSTNTLRIHVIDENSDPVLGVCLRGDDYVYGGTACDGPDQFESVTDPLDGTLSFGGIPSGETHSFSLWSAPPGYLPDQSSVSFTSVVGPYTDVYFSMHHYGGTAANQADLHVQLTNKDKGPGFHYDTRFNFLCFRVNPTVGRPVESLCASKEGELLFRNLPQGSYTLVLARNDTNCAAVASSTPFTVGASDLGHTVERSIQIEGCDAPDPSPSCTVFRTVVGRSVDIYYGTLTGSNGNDLLNTMQLSESISSFLVSAIVGGDNPDPTYLTRTTLAPWTEQYVFGTGLIDWAAQPDWDSNAYQQMVNAYDQSSSDYILGNSISKGSYTVNAGARVSFYFSPTPEELAPYPECGTGPFSSLLIAYTYANTLNLYELNAAETAPASPTPTPIPSPAPMCDTTVTRDLTAYYGTATLPNRTEYNLALSDHIPAALSQAISASNPSQAVG
ncbi:MAG: hypothetical protein ACRDHN_13615, partial [Thermomicrobiales bacterium]